MMWPTFMSAAAMLSGPLRVMRVYCSLFTCLSRSMRLMSSYASLHIARATTKTSGDT